MFKLNLKIAWRNLLKYKSYTAINIVGLSLGLAGFIFIMLFINHEKSYDTWSPELKNVYQVQEYSDNNSDDKKAILQNVIDQRLSKVTRVLPQVNGVTMVHRFGGKMGVTIPGKPAFLQEKFRRSDSLFFNLFPFEFKYGNAKTAFAKPETIVLKEEVAIKYFGNINPIGKVINIAGGEWNKEENPYTVTGVVKSPKTPSVVEFEGMIYEGAFFFNLEKDYASASEIYVKMNEIKDWNSFDKTLQKAYIPLKNQFLKRDNSSVNQKIAEGNSPYLKFVKLSDVHQTPIDSKSWKEILKPVILLSILLLVVSIINFINLATAQAASRAKEIGIKKVVGAHRKSLIFQFLIETFIQCLIAMFIALLLIEILLPTLNEFFALQLSLFNSPSFSILIPQLLIIVFMVGLLTGFYPSFVLSSYKPHEVLKGNYANAKQGSLIRKGLVAIQFVVSISFIIGILIVNYQLNYLKKRDNGFTADGLINIRSGVSANDKYFKKLQQIDGVKNVAFSSGIIGDNISRPQTFKFKNESKELYGVGLGIEGLQALDTRLLAGRFFSANIVQDTINNTVINETAAKMFNVKMVGNTILANDTVRVKIIGIIKDIQVESFENAVKPSIYVVETENWKGVNYTKKQTTLLKYDRTKIKSVTAGIDKLFTEMNQFYPASYTFVEEDLAGVLIEHKRFEKMVALFSILSLTLSLLGLFSLAAFITKQRTKEIAVRKVLGAENTDVLVLLNKGYVWIVLIANLIAFPLAYILIKKWLSTFAYRIDITPLPFVLAFLASILITVLTVSLQASRAIKTNPVKALKYE